MRRASREALLDLQHNLAKYKPYLPEDAVHQGEAAAQKLAAEVLALRITKFEWLLGKIFLKQHRVSRPDTMS